MDTEGVGTSSTGLECRCGVTSPSVGGVALGGEPPRPLAKARDLPGVWGRATAVWATSVRGSQGPFGGRCGLSRAGPGPGTAGTLGGICGTSFGGIAGADGTLGATGIAGATAAAVGGAGGGASVADSEATLTTAPSTGVASGSGELLATAISDGNPGCSAGGAAAGCAAVLTTAAGAGAATTGSGGSATSDTRLASAKRASVGTSSVLAARRVASPG
mmetsp:Transcript_128004/g.221180  ORF Transcript_128004/g.221180 Transcript_128004/m.221180 type:complete len:218 (-) Transcript_128004:240-893(-)